MKRTDRPLAAIDSVIRLLVIIGGSIFASELLIMLFLDAFPQPSGWRAALLDSALLLILTFPVLYFAVFRPLTAHVAERKLAQAAVDSAKQRLEIALEGSQISVWENDLHTNEIWLDAGWAVFLGKPRAETRTTAAELLKMTHPDDHETVIAAAIRIMKGNIPDYAVEHRIMTASGEWKWILSRGRVIERDAGGRPQRLSGTNTDITERKQSERSLREADVRNRSLLEVSPDGIWMHTKGRIGYANKAIATMLGYDNPKQLVGREIYEFFVAEERESLRERVSMVARTFLPAPLAETRMLRQDGSGVDVETTATTFRLGDEVWNIAIVRDITERKQAEQKIRRLSRIQAMLSDVNQLIVRALDRQQVFDEACRIAVEHGGFGIAWIGLLEPDSKDIAVAASAGIDVRPFLGLVTASALRPDSPQGLGEVARALKEKRPVFTHDLTSEPDIAGERRKEAIRRGYRSAIALPLLIEDRAAGVLTLYARDPNFFTPDELKLLSELAGNISFALDQIAKRERANYLAYYDVLTGLPNRALFADRLNQHLQQSKQSGKMAAIMLLDIQRFRNISDTIGWRGSDAILKSVGQRLSEVVGGQSSLARIGVDVFAIANGVVESASDIAHFVENQINGCFSQPFRVDDQDFRLSVRLGIALSPTDGGDAAALHKNAERALLKAKELQEQYLFYESHMNSRVAETLDIENRLRKAVEDRQFVLHYQPKFDANSGAIVGLEALIRWNDPAAGLVPPMEFISILEDTGLILPVGAWAMAEAVNQYKRWRENGLTPPRIAVNLSAIQLRRKDFVSTVREAIRYAGSDDHGLDLEITESLVMTNIADNIAKLKAIREMGCRIAIDDFGTGYSSLQYLSQLPVDYLKIDRSFISRIPGNAVDEAIVSTIIDLAHDLGLKVAAEGIESEEQAAFLRQLSCNEMQGYLFSRSVPADRIQDILRNSKPIPEQSRSG